MWSGFFVRNWKPYGYSCEAPAATISCCRSACARCTSPPAPPTSPPRWWSALGRCTLSSRLARVSYTARRSPSPCKVLGLSTHSFVLGFDLRYKFKNLDTYGHTEEVFWETISCWGIPFPDKATDLPPIWIHSCIYISSLQPQKLSQTPPHQ